jgi:uncharacterized coiled-coil protein SlyX
VSPDQLEQRWQALEQCYADQERACAGVPDLARLRLLSEQCQDLLRELVGKDAPTVDDPDERLRVRALAVAARMHLEKIQQRLTRLRNELSQKRAAGETNAQAVRAYFGAPIKPRPRFLDRRH